MLYYGMENKTYVIATSHRSRESLHRLVGEGNYEEYFNLEVGYNLTEIPSVMLLSALDIKGIRKGKFSDKWLKCWKTEKSLTI